MKVVGSACMPVPESICTTAPETKFVPFTISVNCLLAGAVEGFRPPVALMPGDGLGLIVNRIPADDTAPALTLTITTPGDATSVFGTIAVMWVASTNVLERSCAAPVPVVHTTVDGFRKFEPVTTSWKSGEPTCIEDGFRPPLAATVGCAAV